MCTIGPDSEARAGEREAVDEPRSRKPMPIPSRLPPPPRSSRARLLRDSRVAGSGKRRKKKKRKKADEEERESTADAGSLPGAC